MKIFFIGSVQFSYNILMHLIHINAHIVGVCTKDKSAFNADFKDLTHLSRENGIESKYTNDINNKETIEFIKSKNPDIIFCFGWSSLIKKELLKLPTHGVIGYHPTALPKNRGRHPLIWALALGLKQSASTFFYMKDGADDGDIISQQSFTIDYQDDISTIYQKISTLAKSQITEIVNDLNVGNFSRIPQDESLANSWRKRTSHDGKIDFRMSSLAIYNLVRALTKPFVGAHIDYKNEEIKVWKVREVKHSINDFAEPGKILAINNKEITVKCYDFAITICNHEFETLPQVGDYL